MQLDLIAKSVALIAQELSDLDLNVLPIVTAHLEKIAPDTALQIVMRPRVVPPVMLLAIIPRVIDLLPLPVVPPVMLLAIIPRVIAMLHHAPMLHHAAMLRATRREHLVTLPRVIETAPQLPKSLLRAMGRM